MSKLVARAPAKVNLTLRVLRRRSDGFHDLSSLVAFAGVGDRLTFHPAETLSLHVDGEGAQAAGSVDDNLVIKAALALAERKSGLKLGHFALAKRLPVAAGLGGGSSDAAAALRLLAQANQMAADDPLLLEAARSVGSDVPVCLDPRARIMEGVGDRLSAPLGLPALFAVLVNCRAAVPTPAVFRGLGLRPGEERAGPLHPPRLPETPDALIACLSGIGNDMEEAAEALAPDIRLAKAVLAEGPEARLVRMSGSGATVFALTTDCRAAARLARRVSARYPTWWVKPTVLR